jgi:hypothetical protein
MTVSELQELNLLIEKARHKKMSPQEIEAQRINWGINNAPEGMVLTREDFVEIRETASA